MSEIRILRETLEEQTLSPFAVLSKHSKGREVFEPECDIRTAFGRDVDRIIYSKAFRRLKHKTQVFLHPEGDHYRTRLTHTLEVSRIARTIARSLRLNEDLTEAIALGHDLGHTPFGHAGERVLNLIYPGGFRHFDQSLRVVTRLEKAGQGLNLCYETRTGIHHHSVGEEGDPLEAQIVRYADRIAYINHDADDAIRAGLLKESDLPEMVRAVLGQGLSGRIDKIVRDMVAQSEASPNIQMSTPIADAVDTFRKFMFERVYQNPKAKGEEIKVEGVLLGLYEHYLAHPDKLPDDYKNLVEADGKERIICDYIAGMSDKYATAVYADLFIPKTWHIR